MCVCTTTNCIAQIAQNNNLNNVSPGGERAKGWTKTMKWWRAELGPLSQDEPKPKPKPGQENGKENSNLLSTIPRHIYCHTMKCCAYAWMRPCVGLCVCVCMWLVGCLVVEGKPERKRMNESQSRKVANGNWDILLNVAENKNPNFLYSSNRESAHTHALMYHTHTRALARSFACSHIHINIDIITGCFWLFSLILSVRLDLVLAIEIALASP